MDVSALNPAQRRVLVELMALGQDRPRFDPEVAADLRVEIETALTPLLPEGNEVLWVSKGALGRVHACEAHFLSADAEDFAWNAGNARGTVAHRAVELSLSAKGDARPLDLVDQALTSLGADDPRGVLRPWLSRASDAELADLRAAGVVA